MSIHQRLTRLGRPFTVAGVLAGLATALTLAGPAAAALPTKGTITTTLTSDIVVNARQAGPNLVITEEHLTGSVSGDFTGTSSVTQAGVVHADGSGEFQGRGTFTGTAAGCGSVNFDFNIRFTVSASGEITGTSTGIAGSPVTYHSTLTGSVFSPVFEETPTYKC
jgi:hypothetical protein